MSKLERLATFVTVVEENSFIGASKRLGISNAAVSKQVTGLEDDLGMQLLNRSTRKLSLTEAGQLFFEHARRVANEMNELEALFSGMKAEPSGPLRVTSGRHFAEGYIIPHLLEFSTLYPKVEVQLDVCERVPDLAREGIDINVGHSIVGGPNDIHRKIAETRYVICASHEYLEKHGVPKKPEDLYKHRYLTHRCRNPDNVLNFNKGKQIQLDPYMRFNDTLLMKLCAIQGLGIVKMHAYAVADAFEKKQLVEILKGFDDSVQPIYLCYQPTRFVQPKIRRFIDFFVGKMPKEY